MTKIAIFSDIHANLPALEAVERHIKGQGFDAVFCLGDLGGYAAQPNEVQDTVQSMGCPTVMGNYDDNVGNDGTDCGCHYIEPFDVEVSNISFHWTREHTSIKHKEWLRQLPRAIRMDVETQRVLLCHGSPRDTAEYLFENRSDGYFRQFTKGGKADAHADVILFGHTHVPFHREVDGVHFVNTGSVGRPKDGDARAGYCVLAFDGEILESEQVRVEYDVELTCRHLLDAGLPEYFAEYLRTGGKVPAK